MLSSFALRHPVIAYLATLLCMTVALWLCLALPGGSVLERPSLAGVAPSS